MFSSLRGVARPLRRAATLALGPVLAVGPALGPAPAVGPTLGPTTTVPAEPWPHLQPAPADAPSPPLSTGPTVLHCTVRPGQDGCVAFEPPDDGVVAAVLFAGEYFTGTRVVVHLRTARTGCTPGTTDHEGAGDLGGPLRGLLHEVGSVQTFHRCDVRLHAEHLGSGGTTSRWLRQAPALPHDVAAAAFSLS